MGLDEIINVLSSIKIPEGFQIDDVKYFKEENIIVSSFVYENFELKLKYIFEILENGLFDTYIQLENKKSTICIFDYRSKENQDLANNGFKTILYNKAIEILSYYPEYHSN